MLKRKDFWAGVIAGVILFYIYNTHLKGMGGKAGGS